jgi:hypothetical protein
MSCVDHHVCYSSVNLSPINFSVKMSPCERKGDIERNGTEMIISIEWGVVRAAYRSRSGGDVGVLTASFSLAEPPMGR